MDRNERRAEQKENSPFTSIAQVIYLFSKMQCMRSVAAAAAAHSLKVPLKLHTIRFAAGARISTKRDLLTSTSVLSSMRLKLKIN